MNELRNKNLKGINTVVNSGTASINIGGVVPAGMTRWVTFIAVDSVGAASLNLGTLYLGSVSVSNPSLASLIATANIKMRVVLRGSGISSSNCIMCDGGPPFQLPDRPDLNTPLFSIQGGSWLGVMATLCTMNLFCQYFDE